MEIPKEEVQLYFSWSYCNLLKIPKMLYLQRIAITLIYLQHLTHFLPTHCSYLFACPGDHGRACPPEGNTERL